MNQANWSGYVFTVFPGNTTWNDVGGIYIFAGLNQQNQWVALYIGQTDSFRNRIPSHEQLSPAGQLGASHIHALVVPQQSQRDAIESLLIQNHQPRLNVQLRY
jgi:excinuclease UvrABC nuclease subunit